MAWQLGLKECKQIMKVSKNRKKCIENFTNDQNFPASIEERGMPLRKNCTLNYKGIWNGGTIAINDGKEIRGKDDEFGRAMTDWRRSQTNNDTEPFETVRRAS